MSLRNGKVRMEAESSSNEMLSRPISSSRTDSTRPPRPSPYFLLIYPVLLGLGSLFSVISPIASSYVQKHAYAEPLAPGIISDLETPGHGQPNYFAGKRNLINVYFVKFGWFWTTLAFVVLQVAARPSQDANKNVKHYAQAALRYGVVTLSWILTTQWFFGPALIDRSFVLTGGHCEAVPHPINSLTTEQINRLPTLTSAVLCKAAGGSWRGGHDISGHVFLLVLSSAFLLYELHLSDRNSSHPSISARAAQNVAHSMTAKEREDIGGFESETVARLRVWARYFLYTVVALDFWMLMMTAIWFHTWLEKTSGLLLAAASLHLTYFLGDFVPAWRALLGGL